MFPRSSGHPEGSWGVQPSFPIIHVSGTVVEASTRKTCAGFPTRMTNVDHGPSLPSLHYVNVRRQERSKNVYAPGLAGLDNDRFRHRRVKLFPKHASERFDGKASSEDSSQAQEQGIHRNVQFSMPWEWNDFLASTSPEEPGREGVRPCG